MRPSCVLVGMLIAAAGVAAQTPSEMRMTEAERAEVIELLLKSEQEMLQAIDGLTDQQWTFKPTPERWSVGEVVEHIVLADALLFDTAVKALDARLDEGWTATSSSRPRSSGRVLR